MPTETRTYVGETSSQAFDGFAGFRIGQQYELSYTTEFDEVRLALPHGSSGAGPLVLSVEQFEKWFRKKEWAPEPNVPLTDIGF